MLLPNIVGVELIALPVSISHFLSPSLKSKEQRSPCSVPIYREECLSSIDGDDVTLEPVLYDHTSNPVSSLNAYTWLSSDAMYTFPLLIAGEDFTSSPVVYVHFTEPSFIFNAYTLSSLEPMYNVSP